MTKPNGKPRGHRRVGVPDNPSNAIPAAVGGHDYLAERTRYTRHAADLKQLQADERSGSLIERETVEKAVFELSRQTRDAWSNWPSRVASLMAADLGVDSVLAAVTLEKYVRKHLGELAGGRGLDLSADRLR